jgi:polysaccharide pyruvyl transferase WcaK-like protein
MTPSALDIALGRLRGPILVLGGYGYGNVGDEAMLTGLLPALGSRSVTVVSRRPGVTTAAHPGIRAIGLSGVPLALLRHRTLLIGGGSLFGRDMGGIGRLLPVAGLVARALGRHVAIVGVGIDSGTPRLIRPLLSALGRLAALVVVRDQASVTALAHLGVTAQRAPDLSSRVTPVPAALAWSALERAGVVRGKRLIGLALTAVNAGLADRVEAEIGGWLDACPDAEFVFIPTSLHPYVAAHNDLILGRRLAAAHPRLRLLAGIDDPAVLLAIFGSLDAVVAMRYHALLFATRAAIPVVPLAYAPKVSAWCDEQGLSAMEPEAVGPRLAEMLAGSR